MLVKKKNRYINTKNNNLHHYHCVYLIHSAHYIYLVHCYIQCYYVLINPFCTPHVFIQIISKEYVVFFYLYNRYHVTIMTLS